MNKKIELPAILGGKPEFFRPVPITVPTLPRFSDLKDKYKRIIQSGMITNAKYVQELEEKARDFLGVKYAIAVNSCTSGLILTLKALGLKGEVILPAFTFHATAHALAWNGLKPVFVDCDPHTYNIDPKSVIKAISPKSCAILAVHIFGNPADISSLEEIARRYNLKLIFDAAHGFGSRHQGKNIGAFGDAEVFSLSPTKLLTAAEGGIVATSDKEIARKVKIGRNYGDPGTYDCEFSGLSVRMSEFNAILGIESLKILEKNVVRRNHLVSLYKKLLAVLPGISFQKIKNADRSSFKDFSILIAEAKFGLSRDKLYQSLLAENIIVKKYFYPPVHIQKAFLRFGQAKRNLITTKKISENILSLPLYSHMEEETLRKIVYAIQRIFQMRQRIRAL